MAGDTIFALATGPGRSAIAVVRVSGPKARFALETLAAPSPQPRVASLVSLRDPGSRELLDRALVLWFPGPGSFTGEDVVEFQVHGGRAVVEAVMTALLRLGLRPAGPGEFTRRAFQSGKLDLTEVEGLADLIEAQTESQRRQALRLLSGSLGATVRPWRAALTDVAAQLEAEIDFADEGDVGSVPLAPVRDSIVSVRSGIADVLAGARRSQRLREGLTVVIAGPTNAGKSSLLNVLAQEDVAIVSELPGTTRDSIPVNLVMAGVPVTVVDTAGLRETGDVIEREGVRRSIARIEDADVLLWLSPAGSPVAAPSVQGRVLSLATKIDSETKLPGDERLAISSATGAGIDSLLKCLGAIVQDLAGEASVVSRIRHRNALMSADSALKRAEEGLSADRLELVAEDVRLALRALEALLGKVDVEDVLDRVFSSFCIGK